MAKAKRIFTLLLRVIACGATLAATIVMATTHEKGAFFAISYEVKYTDTPAFKYFVIANAVVSAYSFLVLFIPSKNQLLLWRLVVAFDLVFTLLLASSMSAALAVAQVGKNGNSRAGWLPICGQLPNYCDKVTGALIAGVVGLIIYIALLLYSIHSVLIT